VLDENLSQLVDPVVNQHVARPRDRRRPMRHIVDRRPHACRTILGNHPGDCCRRSDLTGEALHKNCPYFRRLHVIRQTIDGRFHTCPTAHVTPIGEKQTHASDALFSGTT
jgi:hypothetical protein